MSINLENLHKDVAIKFNDEIHLGIESVKKFIIKNGNLFLDFKVSPYKDSRMLYGYNSLGYPVKIGLLDDKIQRIIITNPVEFKRYLMTVSYDGKQYYGFQAQKDLRTIQGELSRIISSINNEETLVQGASRTDSGVHAINQKVHFDTKRDLSESEWENVLNHQLEDYIYVKDVSKVHPLFHARYDVYKKRYVYKIKTGPYSPLEFDYYWHVEDFDLEILKKSMNDIIGKHDFTSFSKGDTGDSTRTIFHTEVLKKANKYYLVFEGDGFLRHMIRILVYKIIQIAQGKSEETISEILKQKNRENTKHMAPAGGLYLDEVIY